MIGWTIWAVALVAYLLFWLWYGGWRGPLSPAEVETYLKSLEGRYEGTGNSPETMRAFLEADDGREFLMLNLVKANLDLVPDPAGGPPMQGLELLRRYSKRFMPVLLRTGGHPGIVARKVGGYVDAWNTPEDPGWTIAGFMRYRSRRDMMQLTLDPSFREGHPDKVAGVLSTFSFPTQRVVSLYASPRVTVALIIALAAALSQLAALTL